VSAFVFRRPVRFDEIDAAGLVYFPKVIALAHEAMERMLQDAVPGGYAHFVCELKVGLPCVHVASDFVGPLRFGDIVEVESTVAKFGTTSVTFDVRVRREDGQPCARIEYVVACADLTVPKKCPLPDDLRRALEKFSPQLHP
jgi:4-hydroxybenzoyl-CoA thioesterase